MQRAALLRVMAWERLGSAWILLPLAIASSGCITAESTEFVYDDARPWLFRDDFAAPIDPRSWNATTSGNGGFVSASGGFLVVAKGSAESDSSFAGLRREFDGDVVVATRVWVSSLAPRAYAGVSTREGGAVAFFRGSGEGDASWNSYRGDLAWAREQGLAPIRAGEFYVVTHERIGDRVSSSLASDEGAILARSEARAIGDGPLRVHFNIERGGSEFLLVDWVEVRAA